MTPDDVETVRQLVHARSGVVVDPTKTYPIETRLAPVARREGFASVDDLIQAIREHRDDRLIWAAAEALAAGETSFFRDQRAVRRLSRGDPAQPGRRSPRTGRSGCGARPAPAARSPIRWP